MTVNIYSQLVILYMRKKKMKKILFSALYMLCGLYNLFWMYMSEQFDE